MIAKNVAIVFTLFSGFPLLLLQQIFENSRPNCEYVDSDITEEQDVKLELQNKLWNVRGTRRNLALKVVLSPCGDPIPPAVGCLPGAAVCIMNTKNPSKSILNAGKYFDYTTDKDSNKIILRSMEGQPCTADENYTVVVEFGCSPLMSVTPTYLYKDDCELHIEMMKSTCTPTCTTRIDGNLIDLRPLRTLGSVPVEELNTKKSFIVSFCDTAQHCSAADVTACETTGDNIVAIAFLKNQRIAYDAFTNDLLIKSHFGSGKNRKDIFIHMKCNWDIKEGIDQLKYIVPAQQGRNYKFMVESSIACIKMPMNCMIRNKFENYWLYDLTSLNKPNGNWKVANVSTGNIYINMCGPLHMSQPSYSCSNQYSQICYVNGTRRYINLGSIAVEFQVTSSNTIKGKLVGGGICAINKTLTYSTEIEFSCNGTENGPVLSVVDGCTYKLTWETPAACAKLSVTGEDCLLSDATGNVNLNNLYKTSDNIYNFTSTSKLRYNFCGPLHKPCNKVDDVSICYENNGQEYIAGYSSKILTRDNSPLSLNLKGEEYDRRTTRMTKIYFQCNHSAPSEGNIEIKMVQNQHFLINVNTPLACVMPSYTACEVYNDNFKFDLSPLSLNNSNYVVHNRDSNVLYIINVCHSVVNSGDYLCPPGTGICMNNMMEPDMKYKYLSLGNVNNKSVPVIESGNLVIHYTSGYYCKEADTLKQSSVIRFMCSKQEEQPSLLKKDACSHEFIWRTPHACGKRVMSVKTRAINTTCKYRHPHTGKFIDLSSIHKILHIEIGTGELYKFTLCDSNYTHCTSNGTHCKTIQSAVQLKNDKSEIYFEYPLTNQCNNIDTQANKLHVHLKCSNLPNEEHHFNFTGISNCTFNINLLTNLGCMSKESAISLSLPTTSKKIVQASKENSLQDKEISYSISELTVKNSVLPDIKLRRNTTLNVSRENVQPLKKDFSIAYQQHIRKVLSKFIHDRRIPKMSCITRSGHCTTTAKHVFYHHSKTSTNQIINGTECNENKKLLTGAALDFANQNDCMIMSTETGSKLSLRNIKPIYINSSTGTNYAVTMNKLLPTCSGYICKNNLQVVSKTDECPAVQFNNTSSMIKLMYSNYQLCDNGNVYTSEIWLKCNLTVEYPSIVQEENCKVVIKYPLQDVCPLLSVVKPYNSTAEISIYSSLGIFIIILVVGVILMRKYPPKIFSRACYQSIPEDSDCSGIVQLKMKEM